eukprot:5356342-Pyramimonas_sp.AAC.2
MEELTKAIPELKNKEAPDSRGLMAEIIKNSSAELRHALLFLYNSTPKSNAVPPDEWKKTVLKTDLHDRVVVQARSSAD